MQVKEICRKYGISDATYYNWKSKYGGMQASDLKRMKELKAELARENDAMRNLIAKKLCGRPPSARRPGSCARRDCRWRRVAARRR
jgi:uncharacterized protein YjcR